MAVSAKDLASELSSLVTIQPDTVTVKTEQNGNTYKFTVTFKSDRGSQRLVDPWRIAISVRLSEIG